MASFSTLALLLAFGMLAGRPAAICSTPFGPHLRRPRWRRGAGLVLIGAGSKAGMVPLHVWLPVAHPAAPAMFGADERGDDQDRHLWLRAHRLRPARRADWWGQWSC